LKYEYLTWMTRYSLEYSDNPDDFYTAYNFLTHHPAFWIKNETGRSYRWLTSKGLQQARMMLTRNDRTGGVTVALSHGRHKPDDYTSYGNDPAMTVHAATYEKAVIALAEKVHACVDLDGCKR
jgi:hypothetical protein